MKRVILQEVLVTVGVLAVFFGFFWLVPRAISHDTSGHEEKSAMYVGTLKEGDVTYNVTIDEVWESDGSAIRIIHLVQQGSIFTGVSGHQFGCRDNGWDRIFINGQKLPDGSTGGCDSVLRSGSGWKFEPCDNDKGRVQPFTESQIYAAASLLDRAMALFHNDDHVVTKYLWNEREKKCEKVFSRT